MTLTLDDFEELPWDQACSEFAADQFIADYPEDFQARVHRGSVTTDALALDGSEGVNLVVIVAGDLRVERGIDLYAGQDEESALTVLVTGNATAGWVSTHCDAMLRVHGDLVAKVVICGGGNLGHVNVQGTLHTELAMLFPENQLHAAAIDGDVYASVRAPVRGAAARPLEELAARLVPDALVDGEAHQRAIRKLLRDGRPVALG